MIDETILQKLSTLARISVSPADVQSRLRDLQSILKCIDVLQQVTIPEGFTPVAPIKNHARMDVVVPASPETVAEIVANFPSNVLGQLQVPQVLNKK